MSFPSNAAVALERRAAAAQPAQGDHDDPGQARRRGGRAARLGRAARGGRGDQGAALRDAAGAARAPGGGGDRARRHGPLGARRGRGKRDRRGDRRARTGREELIKVKSITTDEIELNDALAKRGITAHETDLAELVNQLAGDWSSHILVPAIHRNRDEIRALFERTIASGQRLEDDPSALTATARAHLRELFLRVPFAVSGANFAIAETGTTVVVESEGNGRMCTTLPEVLVTVMGIEKVLPPGATSRSSCSCCRAPRPASG